MKELLIFCGLALFCTATVIYCVIRTEKKRCKEYTKHIAPEVFDKKG